MTDITTVIKEKKKVTFNIRPEAFIKLKIYSAKYNIPYSCVLEGLVDQFTEDANLFPKIDFSRYKTRC